MMTWQIVDCDWLLTKRTKMRAHPGRIVRCVMVLAVAFILICYWSRYIFGRSELHNPQAAVVLQYDSHQTQMNEREPASQAELIYIANFLDVRYSVLDNFEEQYQFQARMMLTNVGNWTVPGSDWYIYFHQFYRIEKDRMTSSGVEVGNMAMRIWHVNGGLFRMGPGSRFTSLHPGQALELIFHVQGASVAKTDISPNWYVAAKGLQPCMLKSTQGESLEFVSPFDHPAKWKRHKADSYNPFTPELRYELNEVDSENHPGILVLPTPAEVKVEPHHQIVINNSWAIIVLSTDITDEANFLANRLGLKVASEVPRSHYIALKLGDVTLKQALLNNSTERYSVHVNAVQETVIITATQAVGVFYGIQSLLTLLALSTTIPDTEILDAPRFPYRGLMIDVSRNFHSKEQLFTVMEAMAMYKLNKLHLHLSDDDGWRLEIPGLPELTKLGSQRCHDLAEERCLIPALGSGPYPHSPGSGYYTVEDYRDILQFAKLHHIEVIPEIDMPAHMRAAIKSMQARYRNLVRRGQAQEAEEYLLSDPQDTSVYASPQLYNDGAVNYCMMSTFTFVSHVLNELVEMHQDIMPLQKFHFGGDEIPTNASTQSPICKTFLKNNPHFSNLADLKENFVQKVAKMAASHGVNLQGWEDGFAGPKSPYNVATFPDIDLYTNIWLSRFEDGNAHRVYSMANMGYKVVITSATHLYFDHPYEPDPEERGLYWATRYISLNKVFGFMPENFYENIDNDKDGHPLDKETVCNQKFSSCPPLLKPQNVKGMEGALWTETVRTNQQLHSMIFPRLLALAERSWHKATWESVTDRHTRERLKSEDWRDFVDTLGYREYLRLEKLGIYSYLPVPGAVLVNGELQINSAIPGLVVQFSLDEGQSWADLTSGYQLKGNVLLATRSHDGQHRSRSIMLKL